VGSSTVATSLSRRFSFAVYKKTVQNKTNNCQRTNFQPFNVLFSHMFDGGFIVVDGGFIVVDGGLLVFSG